MTSRDHLRKFYCKALEKELPIHGVYATSFVEYINHYVLADRLKKLNKKGFILLPLNPSTKFPAIKWSWPHMLST